MKKLILGIDEAGRGAVIGPLVMGGVFLKENKSILSKFKKLGVKDSKQLRPQKRAELYEEIKKLSSNYIHFKISPAQIDKFSINNLEIKYSAKIINKLKPKKAYIDVPSSGKGIKRYCDKIESKCDYQLIIEGANKMDSRNILVSAASIIAKETREIELRKLHKEYGDFGSGYPSDPKTKKWLISWKRKNKKWPKIVRCKWSTISKL